MDNYRKKTFFVDNRGVHYGVRSLNPKWYKQFREEAIKNIQIWKKPNGYYVARNVIDDSGRQYAEETIFFGNNLNKAKDYCNELRREYILSEVRYKKRNKVVY